MATTLTKKLSLSRHDADIARRSGRTLAQFQNGQEELTVIFLSKRGERFEAILPGSAIRAFAPLLSEMGETDAIALPRQRQELTTGQAAAMLHVSRPFLIKLLDEGRIPYRKVGAHRRVQHEDVQAYIERENAARRETLRELAALDQEVGLWGSDDE